MMQASRLLSWLSGAAADAAGRLVLQVAVTAALARLIAPESFGAAALALSLITLIVTIAGGVPFEEALVQRRRLRRAHLESALAASWLVSVGFTAAIIAARDVIAAALDAPELGDLLVGACVLLYANAVTVTLTALARRRRRFNTMARASLLAHISGACAAVAIAVLAPRAGAWAIINFRITTVIVQGVILAASLGVIIPPRLNVARLRELSSFARISLGARFVENFSYFLLNYGVGATLGLSALGQVNMAMRIVEPIRGAFNTIAHNLAYPSLVSAARQVDALPARVGDVAAVTSLIAVPMFLGVAAVSPTLVPLLAGPGWEEAIAIAILMALGAAVVAVVQGLNTATLVIGRPALNLQRRVVGVVAMACVLLACAPLGPIAAGCARVAADTAEAAWTALVSGRAVGVGLGQITGAVAGVWLCAGAMAVLVAWLGAGPATAFPAVAALAALVGVGVVAYAGLLALFARQRFTMIVHWLIAALRPAARTPR